MALERPVWTRKREVEREEAVGSQAEGAAAPTRSSRRRKKM